MTYQPEANARFARVVLDVLSRGDAAACAPEETLRRIRKALHDNNLGVTFGVSFPREESDEDHERHYAATQP